MLLSESMDQITDTQKIGHSRKPGCIVSDNGTEFTSKAILKWANENGVEWHYIDPGKPQQNGYILRRGKQSPGLFADPSSPSTAACATNV